MYDAVKAINEARTELANVYSETQDRAKELNDLARPEMGYSEEELMAEFSDTIAAREAVNVGLLAARDRFHGWLTQQFDGLETDEEQLQFRMALGARIIPAWRNAEGMTLREAAEALDLVASTLSRWESVPDERWPSWDTAVAVVPRMHLGDPSLIPLDRRQKKPWMPYPFPDTVGQRFTEDPGRGLVMRWRSIVGFEPRDDDMARERRWQAARSLLLESVDDKHLQIGQLEMLARLARWPEAIDALRFPPQDQLRRALDPVLGAGPLRDKDAEADR